MLKVEQAVQIYRMLGFSRQKRVVKSMVHFYRSWWCESS